MNMEFNKVLAALLVAGITAYFAGLIAKGISHSETLEQDAYPIAVAETAPAGTGAEAPKGPELIAAYLAKADVAQGEKVSKICASCHTFDKGGPNRIGPNLAGIFGRQTASVAEFSYSDALKGKGGKWDADALNEFLFSPKAFVPGTKMTFAGLKKPEDRAAVIKWLQTK